MFINAKAPNNFNAVQITAKVLVNEFSREEIR